MDSGSKRVSVINAKLLSEAFCNESGFVSDNLALGIAFVTEHPATRDNVGVCGGDGEFPSVESFDLGEFLIDCAFPVT